MTLQGWLVFATFWVLFVTTPGPNAVNCITNGMTYGFRRSLWGVLGDSHASDSCSFCSPHWASPRLSPRHPALFLAAKLVGAGFLVFLGVRGWIMAARPLTVDPATAGGAIYGRAFTIATINAKSVAGYLAAFSQFVQPTCRSGARWPRSCRRPSRSPRSAIPAIPRLALGWAAGLRRGDEPLVPTVHGVLLHRVRA